LAFASILLGSLLAAGQSSFRLDVFVLALLTTLALQILSNYANDLGDTLHGADHSERKGPSRAVQTGVITARQMKSAVIILSIVAFALGITLLLVALQSVIQLIIFLGLGLICIAGAVLYTNGKRPYGYVGLGDVSVLLFFGLVGVLGTLWLYTPVWNWMFVLPAFSAGLLATGVLNVNNLRDISSDTLAGKHSIPVRLGFEGGKIYHTILIAAAIGLNFCFTWLVPVSSPFKYLWIIPTIGLIAHVRSIQNLQESSKADPYLKQLALLALATDCALGGGYALALAFPAGITLT
jgi:1,4-dihydroxy-2-naphthoate octaprenyltransferase